MNIQYTWSIPSIDNYQTLTNSNGEVFYDVIYAVQWKITGSEMVEDIDLETGETIFIPANQAWIYDRMGIDINLSQQFTPRNELTEDIIVGWVKDALGAEKIASLEAQIKTMLEEASFTEPAEQITN